LSNSNNPRYSFVCLSLTSTRWAQAFLGMDALIPLTIPVGDTAWLSADGGFRLSVPDLARDPLAAAPDHPGELQIWAKDKATGDNVTELTPKLPQTIRNSATHAIVSAPGVM
jgi:hypothetical protein